MSYFDLRGARSGKSLTDEVYSFNDLFDKILGNALFAGSSFGRCAARLHTHAVNSPCIYAGGSGNTFTWIGAKAVKISDVPSLKSRLPFVFAEHNRVVTGREMDDLEYKNFRSAFSSCTSQNGFVRSAVLANFLPPAECVFVRLSVSGFSVCACITEQDGDLFIHEACTEWGLLNRPDLWFAGVPYILSEGVITFPEMYQTPRVIESVRTAKDAIFDTVRSDLVKHVIAQTRSLLSKQVSVTAKLDLKQYEKCVSANDHGVLDTMSRLKSLLSAGDYKSLLDGRSIRVSAPIDAVVEQLREIEPGLIAVSRPARPGSVDLSGVSVDEFADMILSADGDREISWLRLMYDKILATTGGVSTDPFNTKISHDTVAYPDGSGGLLTVSGSLLDLTFQVPGVFFFDSLGSLIFAGGGSALSGGLSAGVFRTLYRSTFSHGILNYAPQSKADDPLTRFSLDAMASGDIEWSDQRRGVPLEIKVTTRTIARRTQKISVARLSSKFEQVSWSIPKAITSGHSDLEFSFELEKDLRDFLLESPEFGRSDVVHDDAGQERGWL